MEAAKTQGVSNNGGHGPLGLSTLSQPSTSPVVADIIFIHGLGGGSRKTWSYSPDPTHFWPQKWLSSDPDFANVGIHSFGYAAGWTKSRKNILRITDFANSLLGEISNHPGIRGRSSGIIFCGHSLGGCIAKMTYVLAQKEPSQADLASRICSMIFLGTPHRGSDLAKILSRILSVTLGNKRFVKALTVDSSELKDINDLFRRHAEPLRLWSFYETLPIRIWGIGTVVVEPDSATLGYPGEEIAPLQADHRQICKFESSDDPNYKTIRNSILTAVDAIRSQQHHDFIKKGARLRRFLQIQSMAREDFEALQVLRKSGSCEWLLHRTQFTSWVAGENDHSSIFWLTAIPGSGKSILSSHVLHTLDSWPQTICSGFTFQNAKSTTSGFSECLRSLAYQMAQGDREVLKRLIQLEEEAVPWNPLDDLHAWRRLFVENIFGLPSISRHVWVIDGLDECANFAAVFTKQLLSKAPSNLRIFITSRPLETIERGMRTLGPKVSRYHFTIDDTAEDIARVVTAKLDELGLPEGEDDRREMCDTILRRSSGMFLWVRLVLQEFESPAIWCTEDIHLVLHEIPDGISELYAKCLRPMLENKRTLKLIKPILTWAILGSRMLTVEEIRCAVKLEIHETVHNIEKAIPSICAQLLSVDKGNMVHAIHETFHEFLLSEECPHTIKIDRPRSHSRIATLLLQYLTSEHMRPVVREDSTYALQGSRAKADVALVDYATRHFSDHISESDPADVELLSSLCQFLESEGVLSWMALAAADEDTRRLAKVATHLGQYLDRRRQALGADATDAQHDLIEQWGTDLFRFSCKYGPQLAVSPGSFFDLIPSLCPPDTNIAKTFQRFMPGTSSRALRSVPSTGWGPILASRESATASALTAHGCNLFAGMRGYVVRIYDQKSTQRLLDIPLPPPEPQELSQGARGTCLAFSSKDEYLAIYQLGHIFVLEPLTGALLHTYTLKEETSFEPGSRNTLTFAAADCLVLLTAKNTTYIEWDGQPGSHGNIRRFPLPTKKSPQIPPGNWWVGLAADKDRAIVVFAVLPIAESVVLWDSATDEIIGEYSFSPKVIDWEPDCNPKPRQCLTPRPSWPPKYPAPGSGEDGPSPARQEGVRAFINPSLTVPVLALLWLQHGKFKLSVVNYSSGALLHDTPPQTWEPVPGVSPVASASFSGDGSTLIFLYQDLLYMYSFSIEGDGSVRATARFSAMTDVYDELVPTRDANYKIQSNFDGSRYMLISMDTLSALTLPSRDEISRQRSNVRRRSLYKERLTEDGATGVLPTRADQGGSYLVESGYEAKIFLLFTRSLTTVLIWKHDLSPCRRPRKYDASGPGPCLNLVTNEGRSRAVWECSRFTDKEMGPIGAAFIVADLSPTLAQYDEAPDEQNRPTLNVVLHQLVDSPCDLLLLNKSADRLIRRTQDKCELWDLPSGVHLATRNLWEDMAWDPEWKVKAHRTDQLPLIQRPADSDWLLCVDVNMPNSVAMLSWRDFSLRVRRPDGKCELIPSGESIQPLSIKQSLRLSPLATLISGLIDLVPAGSASTSTLRNKLWRDCFRQYTRYCAIIDPCFSLFDLCFKSQVFTPIAFLPGSRTLVFVASDLWIYSTRVAPHIIATNGGRPRPSPSHSPPSRPAWRSGSGVFWLSCTACGRSHPIRARRHMYSGFWGMTFWKCSWADGGVAPDGRRKMDFIFWGDDPIERIHVRDGLRYADEVEWVEHRNELGQVWKREWRLVEEEASDENTETERAV